MHQQQASVGKREMLHLADDVGILRRHIRILRGIVDTSMAR